MPGRTRFEKKHWTCYHRREGGKGGKIVHRRARNAEKSLKKVKVSSLKNLGGKEVNERV